MRLARTILAFAIVAALAWLPLGGAAAAVAMAHAVAGSTVDVSIAGPAEGLSVDMMSPHEMSVDAAMDCCPDDAKSAPSHHDGGKCPMGACCVAASFVALADSAGALIDLPPARAQRLALPADQVLSRVGGSPPFRPPRA